jgi:hypothetical protein
VEEVKGPADSHEATAGSTGRPQTSSLVIRGRIEEGAGYSRSATLFQIIKSERSFVPLTPSCILPGTTGEDEKVRKSKVSALRTEAYIAERAGRADSAKALAILRRAGVGRPPMKGDELPEPKRRRRARPA